MPRSPCPPGQTRDRVTKKCRDKLKPGRRRQTSKIEGKVRSSKKQKQHQMEVLPAAPVAVYKIQEVPRAAFVKAIKPLYDVIEKKKPSTGDDDVFLKAILSSSAGISPTQWDELENTRRHQKNLEMKMGDFHEEILGHLPGYHVLPVGHVTGCDVMNDDETVVAEVKNRHNTMNSDSAKSVVQKLVVQVEKGREAILILINVPPKSKVPRFKAPSSVKVLTGRQAYAQFSGRESFFDDLQATLEWCFSTFKTHDELKNALLTPQEETS